MDARVLRELELLHVARLYRMDEGGQVPIPRAPPAAASPTWSDLRIQVATLGHEKAPWLFLGEGPGAGEEESGEPFVGQAGKLFDGMLAAIGCERRGEVEIANERQVELNGPRLIVALGKTAAIRLLGTEASLASLRGKVHRYRDIPVIVTYHPAYLLRSLPDKAKAWEDLVFARRTLDAA